MSIEAKMESLSLGDDAAIIAAIKAEGVEKSGFASSIDILKAKCASDTEADALAGLATVKALAEGCPEAEAFNKECLTACKFKTWEVPFSRLEELVVRNGLCWRDLQFCVSRPCRSGKTMQRTPNNWHVHGQLGPLLVA